MLRSYGCVAACGVCAESVWCYRQQCWQVQCLGVMLSGLEAFCGDCRPIQRLFELSQDCVCDVCWCACMSAQLCGLVSDGVAVCVCVLISFGSC